MRLQAEYQTAAQVNNRLRDAYVEPAEMLMNRGQPGDFLHAVEVCEQGIRFDPNGAQLRLCIARGRFATNDLNNAEPRFALNKKVSP